MELPLSIATTPKGPYQDSFGPDGLLAYKYRGTDPSHPDNVGLRRTMAQQLPLVYLHGIVPGKYLALWPVYVVGDDSTTLTFRIAVDDAAYIGQAPVSDTADDTTIARRSYVTATTRVRLHQRSFRERVIAAYRSQCSLCRLRHDELLDAAHIIPDSDPEGEPHISNGIALCKLTMPLSAVSLSALLPITPFTSDAMFLTKQTVQSSDMASSNCMGAGCFCHNPKNSGRIEMHLSGG